MKINFHSIEGKLIRIKIKECYRELKYIQAGVRQGIALGPILYIVYTNDLPSTESTTATVFADDIAILAVGDKQIAESHQQRNPVANKIDVKTK